MRVQRGLSRHRGAHAPSYPHALTAVACARLVSDVDSPALPIAVIASTTATTNAAHCDVLIFAREVDARAAISRIGGDTNVAEPAPLRYLTNIDVTEMTSLTDVWCPPPWEPPTFRRLKFKPLELAALTNGDFTVIESPGRVGFSSPKDERDSFWRIVLRAMRTRRESRPTPWISLSDSSSSRGGGSSPQRWLESARKRLSPQSSGRRFSPQSSVHSASARA